jgi:serine/threonine protein kinase
MSTAEPSNDPLSWERVDRALRELLDLEADEQALHLDALRRAEPAMATRLERLLQASGQAPAFDSAEFIAGVAQTALREVSRHRSGQHFGAWELRELLGSGGMADVYLATRAIDDDLQSAAIKLVHVPGAGWSTESLVREAQVLARLSDPRIARLLDFGRTDAGEPWVAMEFVEGLPIDRWCAQQAASVRERVRLMINVAMAVDHAHRNLVVPRDIKPGNVFVSSRDGAVKLLDFGIARALPTPGTDATRTALRAYTQAYASPEQLTGASVAVASDIYQLGQLLYLLLAESHPFDDAAINPAAQLQAMEAGPTPPSRRARAASASGRQLARQGGIDLDTIALKAMEFEPERRYFSARDFADDLRRWLDGEAISARRGRLYRAGRQLRRHWGWAATATLGLVLMAS